MKNRTASQVKVYAYLTPDPLDDDSCVEVEWMGWLKGFDPIEDPEDGIPPFFKDENIALMKLVEQTTANHFRKSLKNLFPLLKNHLFDHIQIAIDHLQIISRDTAVAAYDYGRSNPEKGQYVMHASQDLIQHYIHWNYDWSKLTLQKSLIWEHEIIHMLDHWEVVKSSVYRASASVENKFTYYLLTYRNEGLADLFYLLNAGYKEVDSIDVAKCVFQRGVQTVQQRMYHDGMTKDDWNKDIFSRMDCYEAGPWLMLDLLRSFEGCWHEKIIDQALREIAAGQPLERSKILEIIRIALRVKLEDFLDYIQPLVPAYKMDIPVGLTQQLTLN